MRTFNASPAVCPEEIAAIASAQGGDLEAFNFLILRHQDALFNTAARVMGDEDAAADALQDALISAWRSLHSFQGGSFRAWLMRTVINKCYDEHRRLARRPSLPLMPMFDGEEIEDADWMRDPGLPLEARVESSELHDALKNCLQSLPANYRTVLTLVDVNGLDYEEAAAALDVPIGSAARPRLQCALREQWPG